MTTAVAAQDDQLPIPRTQLAEQELCDYRAEVKGEIFRAIRSRVHDLKKFGFTQKDLALRLDMDPAQLCRQLKGEDDLRLESLSDLARGLECRLDVSLTPLDLVPHLVLHVIPITLLSPAPMLQVGESGQFEATSSSARFFQNVLNVTPDTGRVINAGR